MIASTLLASLPTHRVRHPARYSRGLLRIFARYLQSGWRILDPMAGTGKIGRLKKFDSTLTIVANEIEREWAIGEDVYWFHTDAAHMTWAWNESFDAIITSPVYGNRMSDTYTDHTRRITYRAGLGRALHPENTGQMQWGEPYRQKHIAIYRECYRTLQPQGLFLLNVSDHVRDGRVVPVSAWHRDTLLELGMTLLNVHELKTPRTRFGKNHELRCGVEFVFVFQKLAINPEN